MLDIEKPNLTIAEFIRKPVSYRQSICCYVDDYVNKKLIDYMQENKKLLFLWLHGIGNLMMFLPVMAKLRELCPKCQVDWYMEGEARVDCFEVVHDRPGLYKEYDAVFYVPFLTRPPLTKQHSCCIYEAGIKPEEITGFAMLPKMESPLVAVHFFSSSCPHLNCPPQIAEKICNEIKAIGKIPIECHFDKVAPQYGKFHFLENNVRGCPARIQNLVGLIQSCCAFVGTISGPYNVAMSVMPDRAIALDADNHIPGHHMNARYVVPPNMIAHELNVKNYKDGDLTRLLGSILSPKSKMRF